MTDVTDDYTTWDAPYVLGSLTRAERQKYEEHLAGCPDCQAAVTGLAGLPGMLALVDTETALSMIGPTEAAAAEAAPPMPQLLPRLADAAERRRRRSRWVPIGTAVAAAAAAVAIAVPIAVTVTGSDTGTSEQVFAERRMEPLEPTPVSASFKLVPAGDRTRVVMSCSYAPSDQRYNWPLALYVTRNDGQQQELGRWPASPGTELTVDYTIDGPPDQVRTVEIRSAASGKVLLAGTV
ncbi:zf-HC2 domain-containing protein [Nocardia sp. NBC_00881]|uniref:anti-sigma factor family protein n=1 Tax=Nocardia sp. NBC_00881 TaxID=2975995 RepID=UPI00386EE8C4|nr:zf-HC2 domain-containing protein [Nocardia sp. NBC_00881]